MVKIGMLCREHLRLGISPGAKRRIMTDAIYCFVGFKADHVSHAVDLRSAADDAAALREAERFLAEHKSCAQVEVWRSGALVGVVPPSDRPV